MSQDWYFHLTEMRINKMYCEILYNLTHGPCSLKLLKLKRVTNLRRVSNSEEKLYSKHKNWRLFSDQMPRVCIKINSKNLGMKCSCLAFTHIWKFGFLTECKAERSCSEVLWMSHALCRLRPLSSCNWNESPTCCITSSFQNSQTQNDVQAVFFLLEIIILEIWYVLY